MCSSEGVILRVVYHSTRKCKDRFCSTINNSTRSLYFPTEIPDNGTQEYNNSWYLVTVHKSSTIATTVLGPARGMCVSKTQFSYRTA